MDERIETEAIYISGVSGAYINFMCGKCNMAANLVSVRPDEPNPSTDLKDISILGFNIECPNCKQEGFFKLSLMGIEVSGVGVKSD